MSDWPAVTVLLITWNRPEMVRVIVDALRKHLHYSGPLRWHIADDQSPGAYVDDLKAHYAELGFTSTVTPRLGWGANTNAALAFITTPYIFQCEDDYLALRTAELDHGVALMETDATFGLVRYDGLAGHDLNLELREKGTDHAGRFGYLHVLRQSPFLYVYSHRPHLKHRRFHEAYGAYTQGLPLGATEENFAKRVYNTKDGPEIAALADGIRLGFEHIGHSRQGTEADRESSGAKP